MQPSSTTSSGPSIRYSGAAFYRFASQKGSTRGRICLSDCGRGLTPAGQSRGMARSLKPAAPEIASYHGEIWTDARGYGAVRLPTGAGRLLPPLEYELCELEAHSSVRRSAELKDGRFAIETGLDGRTNSCFGYLDESVLPFTP
jgi:hypothetical protein